MTEFDISGRKVAVFCPDSEKQLPVIWLNTFEHEGEAVWKACQELQTPEFILAALQIEDWNGDLSPWSAPKVYKKDVDFAGNADQYLDELIHHIIPEITGQLSIKPLYHAIAGYSFAGLFAVWSLYITDVFSRAASASGSFWYPGFLEFAYHHTFPVVPEAVYLSLGDKESRTRNETMASVENCTKDLFSHFQKQHITTTFELTPGNHFQEPTLRMAKGIRWILTQ